MRIIPLLAILGLVACSSQQKNIVDSGKLEPLRLAEGATEESWETNSDSFLKEGYYYYKKGDFPRAIQNLETSLALDLHGEETWPRFVLYYCYLAVGNYSEALSLSEMLLKENPYEALRYQQVGLAQLWNGQTSAAIESLLRALEFEAHLPIVHFYLGIAHEQLKQLDKRDGAFKTAEKELKQILEHNPADFEGNYELATLYLYWKNKLDVVPGLLIQLNQSLSENSDDELPPQRKLFSEFYIPALHGILQSIKGDPNLAVRHLSRALTNPPSGSRADLAEVFFHLGNSYTRLGELQSARAFYSRSAQLDSKGIYGREAEKIMNQKISP